MSMSLSSFSLFFLVGGGLGLISTSVLASAHESLTRQKDGLVLEMDNGNTISATDS